MTTHDVDGLAGHLIDWRDRARSMPPSWAAHGDKIPIRGPKGEWIGNLLPGYGVEVNADLKSVGIARKIPGVLERSAVQRFVERARKMTVRLLEDERGLLTTYDGLLAAIGAGKSDTVASQKASFVTVVNAWSSTFRAAGLPAAGTYTAIPTGATLNRTNPGALSLGMRDPTGGDHTYLYSFGFGASVQNNVGFLVDQLVGCGSINANATGAQTTSSAALTRYATGAGVMAAFEITTALGATPANVTLSYTNQAGTSGQTSTAMAMTPSGIVQRVQPSQQMPLVYLASGDTGIRAVASATFSAAMGAGAVALVLYKPLIMLPGVAANIFISPDLAASVDMLNELVVGSDSELGCLALWVLPNTTASGDIAMILKAASG